jgi:hypothetical protein
MKCYNCKVELTESGNQFRCCKCGFTIDKVTVLALRSRRTEKVLVREVAPVDVGK